MATLEKGSLVDHAIRTSIVLGLFHGVRDCLLSAAEMDMAVLAFAAWVAVPYVAMFFLSLMFLPKFRWPVAIGLLLPILFGVVTYAGGGGDGQDGLMFIFIPIWQLAYLVLLGGVLFWIHWRRLRK